MGEIRRWRQKVFSVATVWFSLVPAALFAAPDFEADLLPYLRAHCLRCHGPEKQEADFRIDTLSANVGHAAA